MGILESLSYGIPCCLTSGTSLDEKNEKYSAGFFSETTEMGVREMIRQAIDCTNYEELCNGALKIVDENYSWEIVSAKMLKQYELIVLNCSSK